MGGVTPQADIHTCEAENFVITSAGNVLTCLSFLAALKGCFVDHSEFEITSVEKVKYEEARCMPLFIR